MWTRFALSVIVIGAAIGQSPPHASASQFITVGAMLENCVADRTSAAWGYCTGYVGAITDRMSSTGFQQRESGTKPGPNEAICPDADNDDFTVTIPLFVNWAQHHPEKQSLPAYLGVGVALEEKWPCRPVN
jgi:hypothetical protein